MNVTSRTQKTIRNSGVAFFGQMLVTVAKFATRTVFVRLLSEEYLGLGGLFSSILSILALSELGIGSALLFFMYKPCAEGNVPRLNALVQLYKRVYTCIGLFILVVGCALTPFLPFLIKEMPDIEYISVYYILYVVSSASSYFFAYKRSVLLCYQNEYIVSIFDTIAQLLIKALQIIALMIYQSYFLFLSIQIVCTVLENFCLAKIVDRKYPFVRTKKIEPLSKYDKAEMIKKVSAMFGHKIGYVIVMTTDNLLISKLLGLATAGLYSNYYLVVSSLQGITNRIITPVTASVGNLVSVKDEKESEKIFIEMSLVTNWLYAFCAICLTVLMQDFISFWIGPKFLLTDYVVYVLGIDFFLTGMRSPIHAFKDTTGTFYNDRFKPIIEAVVNLVVSIPLTFTLGVAGVKLGTIISTLVVAIPFEIFVLYKYYFKKNCIRYVLSQSAFVLYALLVYFITAFVTSNVFLDGLLGLFLKGTICLLIPNVAFVIAFHKNEVFRRLIKSASNMKK